MTKEIRDRIIELRRTGLGYQAIANEVGESKGAVCYICKSRGMGGLGSDYHPDNTCAFCGNGLIQPKGRGRRKKFCSEACRRKWWKAHPEKAQKKETALYGSICQKCGKKFITYGNNHRRYCSRECYIDGRFWT